MSLPKKRLSMKRSRAAVPDEGQHSLNASERAGLTCSTQVRLDETRTGKRTFFDHFMLGAFSVWLAS